MVGLPKLGQSSDTNGNNVNFSYLLLNLELMLIETPTIETTLLATWNVILEMNLWIYFYVK